MSHNYLAKKFRTVLMCGFVSTVNRDEEYEKWEKFLPKMEKKKRRGRPTIASNMLVGARNAWIVLLEEAWPEIGWQLICIRNQRTSTIADIRNAMILLKDKPNAGLADAFYRDATSVANANRSDIHRNRLQRSSLDAQMFETQGKRDMQQRQWSEVRRALREANLEEKVAVKTEAIQRIKLLRETKSNLRKMDREKALLEKSLLDEEAHFCQCLAPDCLDSELSVFMQRLRAQGAAGEPGRA